jgi:hypothetical protein
MIMKQLSPSSKTVLTVICTEGALTHKEIVKRVDFAPRTVRLALKRLKEHELIIEKANLHDMRQIIYQDRRVPVQRSWLTDLWPDAGNERGLKKTTG